LRITWGIWPGRSGMGAPPGGRCAICIEFDISGMCD
jgi:hypothetical protein